MQPDNGVRKVAVVGAGAAGLVTARELMRAGFSVTVFEQSTRVGGLWVYEPATESDALGLNVTHRIHTSLYESLRTNLPRDIMAFSDYSFDSSGGGDDSWPRFPHHTQVLQYLENFCRDFHLLEHIQFGACITRVDSDAKDASVTLYWESAQQTAQESFAALAICNGHYSEPRVPELSNMDAFTGRVLHSHNYRRAGEFAGKRVAVFGVAASGVDIAREIAQQAKQVYWCGDAFNALEGADVTDPDAPAIHYYSCPTGVNESGQIEFKKNAPQAIDVFLYATGYHYHYPFLQAGEINIDNNYVSPLYKQIIPVGHTNVGFIGIPFLLVPFPFCEIQARWFAQVMKKSISLPTEQEMLATVESREAWLGEEGRKQHQFHQLGEEQIDYLNELLSEMAAGPLPLWFLELLEECQRLRVEHPTTFRDETYLKRGPSVVSLSL